MQQKKNILSVLALLLAALSLAVAALSLLRVSRIEADYEGKLAEMEDIHAQLQQEIEIAAATEATEPAAVPTVPAALKSWDLNAEPWYDYSGAMVTLSAVPASYQLGLTADFLVTLDGAVVAEIPCTWDGKAFTATAELAARNGYCYSCVLHPDSENRTEILLDSPEETADTLMVYLADSLTCYGNVLIGDWSVTDSHLNIASCYIQAQLPQLTVDGRASRIKVAKLMLESGGEALHTHWITLNPGEASSSYVLELENLSFRLPQLENGQLLELRLDVTLSDGQRLSASGGSWEYADGELYLAAG